MRARFLRAGLCLSFLGAPLLFAAQPDVKPKTLEQWSQEALERVFAQLKSSGQVQPQAQAFFDTEVAAAPMVFVRNYEVTRETTSVDVDQDRLKGFLNFESQPQQTRICVAVRDLRNTADTSSPDETPGASSDAQDCPACLAFATEVQSAAQQFFERRGFKSVAGPTTTGDAALSGDRAFEDYVVSAQAQGCDDAFLATISSYSDSSVEAGSFKIDSYLQLRDSKQTRVRGQASSKLQESAAAELTRDKRAKTKLAVLVAGEAAAMAANRIAREQQAMALGNGDGEAFLTIQNIPDYQTFATVRDRILDLVQGLELHERLMTSGSVELAYSASLQDAVAKKLRGEVDQFGGVGGVAAQMVEPGLTIKLAAKAGGKSP